MRIRLVVVVAMVSLLAACGAESGPSGRTAATTRPATGITTTQPAAATASTTTTTSTPAPITAPTTSPRTTSLSPTTIPADTEPPPLEVTWPTSDTPVERRIVTFEGRTEAGAAVVAAGRYAAEVDASGAWSVTLVLNPGGNMARFTATDAAGNVTEVTLSVVYRPPLPLRPDGLGLVAFGESVDDVMDVLTDLLGPPDWDEIQQSAEIDRSVQWDRVGLYVQFTTWDHFDTQPPHAVAGGPVLHYYLTESDLLTTPGGIRVGSTLAELESVYPNVRYEKPCDDVQWSFAVDHPSGWIGYRLFGMLDGELNDPATRIVHVGAGLDRTPC